MGIQSAILNLLPARLGALADLRTAGAWIGWGGALNGQVLRQKLVREILAAVECDTIIETGSYRGATTEFFGYLTDRRVLSVEKSERYYLFAKRRCGGLPHVEVFLDDSRSFLKRIVEQQQLCTVPCFFYLDAHWGDTPRFDELRLIMENWQSAIVMIDDFGVPGDLGYGYAIYGNVPLDERVLPEISPWKAFYPSASSALDTGARRGCLVIGSPNLAGQLESLPGLRLRQ